MMMRDLRLWPIPSVVVVPDSCTAIIDGAGWCASRKSKRICHAVCGRRVTPFNIDLSRNCTWSRHISEVSAPPKRTPSRARFLASGLVNFERGKGPFELISARLKACDNSNNSAPLEMLQGRKKD